MKIFEIGVGVFAACRTREYIGTENTVVCFEPNPHTFQILQSNLGNSPNFTIHNLAIGDVEKESVMTFNLKGDSSFLDGVKSPEVSYKESVQQPLDVKQIQVTVKNIKEFDNGDIDILLLDMEGAEWFVIKNLISRPKKIVIEMQSFGSQYKNPYFNEIIEWMQNNNYKTTDSTSEDFTFEL